jgi:hypothetical protein
VARAGRPDGGLLGGDAGLSRNMTGRAGGTRMKQPGPPAHRRLGRNVTRR